MKLKTLVSAIALTFSFAGTGVVCAGKPVTPNTTVKLKIVAINDFHGQLESPGSFRALSTDASGTVPVGGVDYLAGYIADIKSKNIHTTVVSAGDLIGASPVVSALFHDEATIETMNRLGLEINAVGNHEFDEGKNELLRMQNGGCHPVDSDRSCQGAKVGTAVPFEGAAFKFLAANVVEKSSGESLFPAYDIKEYDGVKVAFIGMTLKETPTIVTPSGVAGLRFKDEIQTVNHLIPKLQAQGVKAVVVLIHQGGVMPIVQSIDTINTCDGNLEGSPIKTIVKGLSNAVNLVISGHTHQAYNCKLATKNPKHLIPVTSANSQGRILTTIDMELSKVNGAVKKISAVNVAVDRGNAAITPDADIAQIVANYKNLSTPIANRVIGRISADLTRTTTSAGENVMGNVIADAQLAATQAAAFGGAQVAFMNPGGVRADLMYASSAALEGDGNVTFGEAFIVQPFGNSLVTLSLTGAQIEELLEQQFMGCTNAQSFNRILLPSTGFSYAWRATGADCDKIDPNDIKINGVVVDPAASYRVTVNSFLADGGDKFNVLTKATNRLGGAQDSDALEAYFKANSPIAPVGLDRIQQLP
ncbi:MAG: bifunctional metallophosphatase/5'-nucleotidase [Methylovulum sp.]|jgi:5'-nucleotidase|nr:bifunctional metallophosphatase/5'-nucleotidase [Methylovulum sp.]MCF7997460.1 bifunctional metallophosphatase/5'-nucleotidase [Methylovulum sp.]